MKKGRFLWSAHRITERQKAGKARSIKGKQLKNSRNTDLKQLVEHLSSQSDRKYILSTLTYNYVHSRNPMFMGFFVVCMSVRECTCVMRRF